MKKIFFIGLLAAGAFVNQGYAQNGTRTSTKNEVKSEVKTSETPKCHQASTGSSQKSCCQAKANSGDANATTAQKEVKPCCQKGQTTCDKPKESK